MDFSQVAPGSWLLQHVNWTRAEHRISAIGLDAGPMSGFDNAKVDAEFFAGTSWRSNFLCAIGHGDPAKVFDRLPRLPFEETCRIL